MEPALVTGSITVTLAVITRGMIAASLITTVFADGRRRPVHNRLV
jgi:hypothetical protein